jgi:peptidoglycan/LPS O-acetylase OafA/YrhL
MGSQTSEKALTGPSKHVFHTLDALRGIAAITVVAYHNPEAFHWNPHRGFLAVDLFFVLSGFVLSYSYQSRLDQGYSSLEFMKARFIRLAPLYILALVLGLIASILLHGGPEHATTFNKFEFFALNLFFIPIYYPSDSAAPLFPFNAPSWSLLLELSINLVHANLLRRVSVRFLGTLCGISGTMLVAAVSFYRHQNIGWDWGTLFTGGIPRVVFSYCAGMFFYKLWEHGRRAPKLPAITLLLIALICLSVNTSHGVITSLAITIVVFPLLVFAAACVQPGPLTERMFVWLGLSSYAIYVLHTVTFQVLHAWVRPINFFIAYGTLAFLVVASIVLDKFYDLPVRRYLRNLLMRN